MTTTRRAHPADLGDRPALSGATLAALRRQVLAWYDARRRDLPWRRAPSLYGIWISEMMLQQTTVAAVVPFWQRFVARFPDVAALAAASESEVLAHWSGLGYYRRARHLHAAAGEIVATAKGRLPQDVAGWRALPGVGPYAAGAIASIGLGLPVPAVDANVRRVLTRWLAPDPATAAKLSPRHLEAAAAAAVDPQRPGDWNQALMELGATVCRARSAACGECPARSACRAAAGADPAAVGRLPERRSAVAVVTSALTVRCTGRVLVLPTASVVVARARGLGRPLRDDLGGLHQGFFAPPQTPWYARREGDAAGSLASAWRGWLRDAGLSDAGLQRVGRVRHAITHHDLWLEVYRVDLGARAAAALDGLVDPRRRWATLRESADGADVPPLTTPARRCLALGLESPQSG